MDEDALDVGLGLRPNLEAGEFGADVHRQRLAERDEAGMHLAADGAAMGAFCLILRQQARLWRNFVQELANRQRVPYLQLGVG